MNLISALQSSESPKRQKYTNQYDLYRVGGDVKHYSIQSNTPTRMKNEKKTDQTAKSALNLLDITAYPLPNSNITSINEKA